MEIILSGSIANFSRLTNEKLLSIIKTQFPDMEFYTFQPTQGKIYAASKDWKAVAKLADLLGIATAIWLIYSEFILPHKTPESNAGIVIHIENAGQNNTFWIGGQIQSREDLIIQLSQTVNNIESDTTVHKDAVKNLKNSSRYKIID